MTSMLSAIINECCIPILVIFGLGWLSGGLKLFNQSDLAALNRFVFLFCFPVLIFRGLANNTFKAEYVQFASSYLIVTLYSFILAGIIALFFTKRQKLREFTTHFPHFCWANSVLIGIPVINAIFGEEAAALYPILHTLASVVVQMPIVVFFFELTRTRKDLGLEESDEPQDEEIVNDNDGSVDGVEMKKTRKVSAVETSDVVPDASKEAEGSFCGKVAKKVGVGLLKNPTVWAMVLGLIWGATPWDLPVAVASIVDQLAGMVTPGGIFAVGLFFGLYKEPIEWKWSILYFLGRMVGSVGVIFGFVKLMGFDKTLAHSAMALAGTPVALAAFTHAKEYDVNPQRYPPVILIEMILLLPVQYLISLIVDVFW
ncbi:Membrane transport protein like protein [Aduncisulcus paluster]|uniref:Membrane transport protein like protein n=1 Tax=Aduncisulcus paluster TaxID=2918883 RepID=A0ABQ5KRP4_9EUKA|nr:Membrane transport protein like protein [Aduncisulcus paluster]